MMIEFVPDFAAAACRNQEARCGAVNAIHDLGVGEGGIHNWRWAWVWTACMANGRAHYPYWEAEGLMANVARGIAYAMENDDD